MSGRPTSIEQRIEPPYQHQDNHRRATITATASLVTCSANMDVNVSELVAGILESLGSSVLQEINWIYGVKDELTMIKQILLAIDAVLLDAQNQQSTSKSTRLWLLDLKSVAYDIEDVLDLIATQDLELKVNGRSLFRKVTKLFTDFDVARELKAIRRSLEMIEFSRRNFNFQEQVTAHGPVVLAGNRETYSYVRGSNVVGREEDRGTIVSCLTSSSSDAVDGGLYVIPIIGIGGMGKTTLAKLLYNDPGVVSAFELRLWVYVSKKFVLRALIVSIVQSATGMDFSCLSMQLLQNKLHEELGGRTFLLILDDVWIRDPTEWMELKELLSTGSPRSKVIVITREERVASITGTVEAYKLKGLSDDHCWSIFAKQAFRKGEEEVCPLLVAIGKSIVQKCLGVPLAAKTLGSLLHSERDVSVWKRIEESELWMIEQGPNDILPALKLSYDHTPYHLRSCFALCAVMGKGYPMLKCDLINMWMALKLVKLREGDELEDIGDRYFNELLSRSFIQLSILGVDSKIKYANMLDENSSLKYGTHSFKNELTAMVDLVSETIVDTNGKLLAYAEMHDLMHDLATYVSDEEVFIVTSFKRTISQKAMHIVWEGEDLSRKEFPMQHLEASKARVFAFVQPMGLVSKSFLKGLISNFKCLRILILRNSEFEELPDTIGGLKHLRYLSLSWNLKLIRLPQSICKLVNLQTLDLFKCIKLEILPKDIHKLLSLRFLILTSKLKYLPKEGLCGLSSLRVLALWGWQRLMSLLEGIGRLNNLRLLFIACCDIIESLPNDIKHLTNLQELRIYYCGRLELKGWEGLHGLRSLEYLDIVGLPKLSEIPDVLNSSAGCLQYLRISKCEGLRAMPQGMQHCTSLLRLILSDCPNLAALPRTMLDLKCLQELIIDGCPQITRRCEKNAGSDWDLISHIPRICIDHQVILKEAPPAQQG